MLKRYRGSFIFALLYLFVIAWFHWNRVWVNSYSEEGLVYLFYNGLRIVFFFYFILIPFVIGRQLLFWIGPKTIRPSSSPLGYFLCVSYLGTALLQIFMVILGFLHLFYLPVALILTLPAVFFSFPILKRFLKKTPGIIRRTVQEDPGGHRWIQGLLAGMTLLLWMDILIKKGLFPDIVGNDPVGHYLPYFNEVLSRHHLWPNPYYPHYFFSKGAGLYFLGMLLTDLQGSQPVSFYYLTLSAVTLFAVAKRMSSSATWGWLAVAVYLKSFLIPHEAEFAKNHIATTSWLAAILWFTLMIFESEKKKRIFWTVSLALMGAALTLQTPPSLIVTLPFFFTWTVIYWIKNKTELAKTFLTLSVALCSLMGFVFLFNYLSAGVIEITPSNIFLPHANISIMKQWWSPFALLTQFEFNAHGGAWLAPSRWVIDKASFWEIFKLPILQDFFPFLRLKPSYLLAICFYLFPFILGLVKVPDLKPYFKRVLLGTGIVSAISLVILLSTRERNSLINFTQFFNFYTTLVGLAIWSLVFQIFRETEARQKVSTVVGSVLFCFILFDYAPSAIRLGFQRYPFLLGRMSFQEVYKGWVPESCLEVRSFLGSKRVALLNFFPGCYSLPGVHFERPLMNSYVKDYPQVMFESAEKARETFQQYDVNYFLVDLKSPFHFTAFSPLFQPDSLKRYLKIVWQSGGAFLLTWKEGVEGEIEGSFLKSYTSKYQTERQSFIAGVNDRIKNLYQNPSHGVLAKNPLSSLK